MKTNTPTQEQFQTLLDAFEKVNIGNCLIDMGVIEVNYCGTPMCHGGWYAVAKEMGQRDGKYISYQDGAEQMAIDLGFTSISELTEWAGNNECIWGNDGGEFMFSGDYSFGDRLTKITHLSQIIDHWKGVKERAAKLG